LTFLCRDSFTPSIAIVPVLRTIFIHFFANGLFVLTTVAYNARHYYRDGVRTVTCFPRSCYPRGKEKIRYGEKGTAKKTLVSSNLLDVTCYFNQN